MTIYGNKIDTFIYLTQDMYSSLYGVVKKSLAQAYTNFWDQM